MNGRSWEESVRFYVQSGLLDQVTERFAQDNSSQLPVLARSDTLIILQMRDCLNHVRTIGSRHLSAHVSAHNDPPNLDDPALDLAVIRGLPGLGVLRALCHKWQIEPALLLDLLFIPRTYRILPIPSATLMHISVRLVSLVTYGAIRSAKSPIDMLQDSLDTQTNDYQIHLLKNEMVGAEQYRKVNLHGRHFFSVEQEVAFLSCQTERGWKWIILNDSGFTRRNPPWNSLKADATKVQPFIFPMTRQGQFVFDSISFPLKPIDNRDARNFKTPDPCQSRAENDNRLLITEVRKNGQMHPLLLAYDLIDSYCLSWTRLFSFLRALHASLPGDAEEKAQCLRNDKLLVDRASAYTRSLLRFIDGEHSFHLPSTASQKNSNVRLIVASNRNRIRKDLKALHGEAELLSRSAGEAIAVEMSTISILESKRSLSQAKQLERLSYLAYIFLPLGLVTSGFGMNLDIINNTSATWHQFLAVALPFTGISLLLPFWNIILDALNSLKQSIR